MNGHGTRNMLFLMPAMVLGLSLLFQFIPLVDPRRVTVCIYSYSVWRTDPNKIPNGTVKAT